MSFGMAYYVIARAGAGRAKPAPEITLLAGPFGDHGEAMALLESAGTAHLHLDRWAWFDTIDTIQTPRMTNMPRGCLNQTLGLSSLASMTG